MNRVVVIAALSAFFSLVSLGAGLIRFVVSPVVSPCGVERVGPHITGWIGEDGKPYWLETLTVSDSDKRLLSEKLQEVTK